MARRILNRKEMRADFDAAERKKEDPEETDETEEEADDDAEDEEEGEGEAEGEGNEEADGDAEDEGDEGDDEDAPKKKKKKKVVAPKVKAKPKAKPRSRAAKVVRMKVIWGVFDNSNRRVAVYEYPRRAEADAHAKKLTEDKKSTHFVQPVKEQIEEKKE